MKSAPNEKLELKNEFATVQVYMENSANGPRLVIKDMMSQEMVYLDPLQLECITRMDLTLLEQYLPY